MNRLIKSITLCLIALLLLTSCKQQPGADSDRPEIALVMKSLANEFFKTMADGAIAHRAANPDKYDLTTVGIKNEQDVGKQIDLVQMMIAKGVDAIVIAPADSKALVPICKKAVDAGIVVVNIDNKFDAAVLADQDVKIPFVGPDNRKGARIAGEYLTQKLKAGDKVAIIEGIPSAFNGIQRKLGFEDAAKAAQLEIVSSQSGHWEMDKANKLASAVITEHPEIKAILCANDSMALGVVSAVGFAGKSDDILVIGFDNISGAQQLLKEGKLLCTIDQHGDKLAAFGIEYALEMLAGTTPEDKETPVDLITAETLESKTQ